ncbi:MAG TPA: proton-conducting transporter membrane subunit, partial [candidate division Zixibacteria bacterium]|nr:proton-conducting transporter membrane subunit [candidate division Zixibacteria bacterium]
IGAAFILAFFLLMGQKSGSLDFNNFSAMAETSGLLFILALIGFGSKAGFIPLHVWLPEAHPAAPSHISALLSGVMIKMGIYGLFRTLTFFGQPEYWWGILLIAVGLSSGVLGVLLALVQSNMKRLLAYSSVENMGIIAIGMGLGALGWSTNSTVIMVLGFGGALLHCINHALFKSALFLAAGSVLQRCGTLKLDQLGGLIKGMPRTSLAALIASISIAGLPIGNGFVGEFLLYVGALSGASSARTDIAGASIAIAIGLSLIAGLAAVCFAKFFGIGFLGAPRSESASKASESNWLMTVPMTLLASLCLIIGLSAYAIPEVLASAISNVTGASLQTVAEPLSKSSALLSTLTLATVVIVLLVIAISMLRFFVIRNRPVRLSVTWDCGYAAPSAKMQYRGYSFIQTVTGLFAGLLSIRKRMVLSGGLFPRSSLLMVKAPDAFLSNFYEPLFRSVGWTLGHLRRLQHGNLQLYILYILITLLALMFWKLQ